MMGRAALACATELGAKGPGEPSWLNAERVLFEAWMAGHCWVVGGEWTGVTYQAPHEHAGVICPVAMHTRQLWAAWRDRAALQYVLGAAGQDAAPAPGSRWLHKNGVVYTVLRILNEGADDDSRHEYPLMVEYQGADGRIWAKSVEGFLRSRVPLETVCAS